ncbi:MAG: GNAT family N-acetyltransferase [Bacteroidota bacterium]
MVGYATYFFSYHTWTGKSLYMDDLYVKSDFRKQGIGKKLLNTVIEFARKKNVKRCVGKYLTAIKMLRNFIKI